MILCNMETGRMQLFWRCHLFWSKQHTNITRLILGGSSATAWALSYISLGNCFKYREGSRKAICKTQQVHISIPKVVITQTQNESDTYPSQHVIVLPSSSSSRRKYSPSVYNEPPKTRTTFERALSGEKQNSSPSSAPRNSISLEQQPSSNSIKRIKATSSASKRFPHENKFDNPECRQIGESGGERNNEPSSSSLVEQTLEYALNEDGSVTCKLCEENVPSRTHWYRHKYKVSTCHSDP